MKGIRSIGVLRYKEYKMYSGIIDIRSIMGVSRSGEWGVKAYF